MPALLLALLAGGCETARREWREGPTQEQAAKSGSAPVRREYAMNQRWQNRPLSELKAALGEPQVVMQIPGGGNPPGFAAVYGADPTTGCIDAFAFFDGDDPVIRVYHCR